MERLNAVQFVDYDEARSTEEAIRKRWPSAADSDEDTWERYHEALCKAAERFGEVGDDPDPESDLDFYYSGDWSHYLEDGFALRSPRAVSAEVFRSFQAIAAAHHPDAIVCLQGEMFSPISGLDVLITASVIYVSWLDKTPTACRKGLKKLGLDV